MNRLLAALRLDWVLQLRYGFFYAAGFSLLVWLAILKALPQQVLPIALPLVVFLDLSIVGFYFMAGMVLFEKGENTLSALVVTPLRFWEYLSSKLITLTLMAVGVSMLLILANPTGVPGNVGSGLLGVIAMSVISLLIGLISVSPFRSLSTYMIPSQAYVLLMYAPIPSYFGWVESPFFYLFPTQGALLLLKGLFSRCRGLAGGLCAALKPDLVAGLTVAAQRLFNQYVIAREGER
ncbi:MAG: fluoroquinolone transporter permease [Synechococcaceae cyanobacterium SM2_3_1]|nr:fluoroquinolone transporter permease [Synechococcaceae cyanobacterium SM2_3_1]